VPWSGPSLVSRLMADSQRASRPGLLGPATLVGRAKGVDEELKFSTSGAMLATAYPWCSSLAMAAALRGLGTELAAPTRSKVSCRSFCCSGA